MNKEIIYINHQKLADPRIKDCIEQCRVSYPDIDQFLKMGRSDPGTESKYLRSGKNTYPFKSSIVDHLPIGVPDYNPNFSLTFGEVSDQRAQELRRTKWDRPWLVFHSGGVDSTVILTSILKNFSTADLSNIHVASNYAGVYENPKFFMEHISPNFRIIDSSELDISTELLNKYYVINGEFGDQLYAGPVYLVREFMDNADLWETNIRTNPDRMLQALTDQVDKPFANWYYETLIENINSTNIPMETYHDFNWWFSFNVMWSALTLRSLKFSRTTDDDHLSVYLNSHIPWFNTTDYQQWSMNNNKRGEKYSTYAGLYKTAAKRYIYDYDHDKYYYAFKPKLASSGRKVKIKNWFCMLSDFSTLNLDDNLQQIIELFPAHINR